MFRFSFFKYKLNMLKSARLIDKAVFLMNKKKMTASILLILATLMWGSSFAVRKIGMESMGPLMFNAFRSLAGFLFVFVILAAKSRKKENKSAMPMKIQLKVSIAVATAYSVGSVFQQLGLFTVDAGKSGFITSLYTIFVPLLNLLLFRINAGIKTWIGAVLAFSGLLMITSGGIGFEPGCLLLLAGAICFSVQIIIVKNYAKGVDPFLMTSIQLAVCTLLNFSAAAVLGEYFEFDMIRQSLIPVIYTGVLSLGAAHVLQYTAQKNLSAPAAAVILGVMHVSKCHQIV